MHTCKCTRAHTACGSHKTTVLLWQKKCKLKNYNFVTHNCDGYTVFNSLPDFNLCPEIHSISTETQNGDVFN